MNLQYLPLRQTVVELLSAYVCRFFPGTYIVNNTVDEIGFSADFIFPSSVGVELLTVIEEKLHVWLRGKIEYHCMEMISQNAVGMLNYFKQPILAQRVQEEEAELVHLIQIEEVVNLSHSNRQVDISEIKTFKLFSLEKRKIYIPSLGRVEVSTITGTAFNNNQELKKFLKKREEAKKRDSLLLGPQIGLFQLDESKIFPLWKPKGLYIFEELKKIITQENAAYNCVLPLTGYPRFLGKEESLFGSFEIEDRLFEITPSMSRRHAAILAGSLESKENYPKLFWESRPVYSSLKGREALGVLNSPCQTEEETTIFCAGDQLLEILTSRLHFIKKVLNIFGIEVKWVIYPIAPKSFNRRKEWERNLSLLTEALEKVEITYVLDKEDHSLYGPKVEAKIFDVLGRSWTGPSILIDLETPQRFKLQFEEKEGGVAPLSMITQSVFGSLDRFIALLIEHWEGEIPLWLAPEQIRVIPVGIKDREYALEIDQRIKNQGFRSYVDCLLRPLSEKIHIAEQEKIPYIIVVGDREKKRNVIAFRSREKTNVTSNMTLEAFLEKVSRSLNEIGNKNNEGSG